MSMEVRIQYWTVTNSLECVTTCPNDVGEIIHEECEEQKGQRWNPACSTPLTTSFHANFAPRVCAGCCVEGRTQTELSAKGSWLLNAQTLRFKLWHQGFSKYWKDWYWSIALSHLTVTFLKYWSYTGNPQILWDLLLFQAIKTVRSRLLLFQG